jgi:hypothetical protein
MTAIRATRLARMGPRSRPESFTAHQGRDAGEASSTEALFAAYLSCATAANAANGVDFKVNGDRFGCIGDVHLLSFLRCMLTSLALSREQAAQGQD